MKVVTLLNSCDASELFHLIRVNFFFRDRHVEVAQNHPFWRSERSLQQFMVLFDSESVIPAECSDFVTISLMKHNVTVGVSESPLRFLPQSTCCHLEAAGNQEPLLGEAVR